MSNKYAYEIHAYVDGHEVCMTRPNEKGFNVAEACTWFDTHYNPAFRDYHIHARDRRTWKAGRRIMDLMP